jgi:Tol biopolymer transport system component
VAISDQGTRAAAAVSNTGTLVYRTGTAGIQTQLVWYDRNGKSLGSIGSPAQYRGIALSPDDTRVAVHIHQKPTGGDIWILDQERGTSTRLTFHASHNLVPTWSRDGKMLAFASDRDGGLASVYQKASSGAGEDELIVKTSVATFPEDWAPDQRVLTIGHGTPGRAMGIWLWPTTGERKETPIVDTEFSDILSKFSPDGRWIAYTSNESGRNEIYVRPYPQGTGKWQVSNQGGNFVR